MHDVRREQISRVSEVLGGRSLAFFGIRGHDALPLLAIPEFRHCFGVTASAGIPSLATDLALEDISGRRVDLDRYDIDDDDSSDVSEFRQLLRHALSDGSVLVTYRPSHFLSDLTFSLPTGCDYWGLFKERHTAYEYKPWVERLVAAQGIKTIPWRYVPDTMLATIERDLRYGPVVLRRSKSSGGVGTVLVEDPEGLSVAWPRNEQHFVAVAPYLSPTVPVNVGAVVYGRDIVRVHTPSVQLIGLDGVTAERFGYCGNDLPAMRQVSAEAVREMDAATRTIGLWLGSDGYRGSFGVDFLVHPDAVYFAEINARMQGSTLLTSTLEARTQHIDLTLSHVSALAGLPPLEDLHLSDWILEMPPTSQVVVHNSSRDRLRRIGVPQVGDAQVQLLPPRGVGTDVGGVLGRVILDRQVTQTGFEIANEAQRCVQALVDVYEPG